MAAPLAPEVEVAAVTHGARVIGVAGRIHGKSRYQLTLVCADGSRQPMGYWIGRDFVTHPVARSMAEQHAARFLPARPTLTIVR